ncbi:MAG: PDZ domain-containing protein [Bacteroidota bacterium]
MKWVKTLSVLLTTCLLFSLNVSAQSVNKTAKIVKKTIDKNGNEQIEEIYAEGEDVDAILEEFDVDFEGNGKVEVEIEVDEDGNEVKRKVRIESNSSFEMREDDFDSFDSEGKNFLFKFDNDGEEQTFRWEGLEKMPEELERMLEDLDTDFDFDFDNLKSDRFNRSGFNFYPAGRASLGVRIENGEKEGAAVVEVAERSAAEEAGIEIGDVITAINGISVSNVQDVIRKIGKYEPQERIEIDLLRDGKAKTVKAVLKERSI